MENIVNDNKRRKLNRPITGIIEKDRIWEQWYDIDSTDIVFPKKTQKDYLFECIGDEKDRIIINNRNIVKYSEEEFKKLVYNYECSFAKMNLKKGDVICTIGLTTPELYAIKYSATQLGLITCNLNVFDVGITDEEKNRLYRQLELVNPKMIFTLDYLENKVFNIINDPKFSNAMKVRMPLAQSLPIFNPEKAILELNTIKNFLTGKKISKSISLNTFLSYGKNVKPEEINEVYEEGMPCNISFTSGTTGINKAVLLSHDANNALAYQQKLGKFGFERGTKNLALVPPFLAFWDADIVHAVLCLGGVNVIELELSYDKMAEYFKKYGDINMGIWSQYLWEGLLKLPDEELKKVSQNLKHVIIGGERCEINAAEKFYDKTGVVQMTGFGASEVNTTFSITHPNCTKMGSSGLPLPGNNVKILDDSGVSLSYNQPGKLFITGPCLMNGYYRRPDLTNDVIHIDEDGVKWYYTKDYAVVDEDGCLTVLDRYSSPVVIKSNNKEEKVNMLDIIEIIKKDRNVKHCKMTYHEGQMVLHLSLDDYFNKDRESALDSVLNTIRTKLPEKYWPNYIKVYEQLPRTQVGKVDYKTLNLNGNSICENSSDEKMQVIKQKTLKR